MTIDIEETVAKLRNAKNEDDLFHKIRKCEKEYIAEIERVEEGKDKEAIKNSIGKLMAFYQRALEIATFGVTRDRIIANIQLWESHAFRKDIEIEPITRFPLPVHPLPGTVELPNLGDWTELPNEIITTVQKSMTDFKIEYAEYVFLDEGILTVVYTKIKEAINSSTTEDEGFVNLSNVVNTYSTLNPLKLFIEQQKKNEDEIYNIFEERHPFELEALLRGSRACVPHYEITISALDLAAAAILAGFFEARFLPVVASHVTSLLREREIREKFFESKVNLFEDLFKGRKTPEKCRDEFFAIMKTYLNNISEIRNKSDIEVSEECKSWIRRIANELKEQGRLSKDAIKTLREQLDINVQDR